jgi:hypothetical protein
MIIQRERDGKKERKIEGDRNRNKDTYNGNNCLGCPWDRLVVSN